MQTTKREEIALGPLTIGFLLRGEGTGGSVAMFEFSVPAEAKVPVAHSHDGYEETLFGLEAVLTWTVDGRETEVAAGEVLHIPRGVVHKFENRGSEDAKALAVITPGILGPEYFRELADIVRASQGPPDPAAIGEVMRRHGLTPVAP